MALSREARALPLIALIQKAAIESAEWDPCLSAISAELGGPAVMLTLQLPHAPASIVSYRVHSEPDYGEVFAKLAARGDVPWPLEKLYDYGRFVRSAEFLSSADLEQTDFFKAYMEPQGLVAEDQTGLVFGYGDGLPLAALGIYRRVGGRAFTAEDIGTLDLLVPHLRLAYETYCKLRDVQFRRDAIAEVMDRFPMGVVFLDRDLQVVDSNRAAERILASRDGLVLRDGSLRATEPGTSAEFVTLCEHSVRQRSGAGIEQRICPIPRPSGLRPYELLVTGLATSPDLLRPRQAAVVVFIADPHDQQLGMPDLLLRLHDLTRAEAELAALLCAGGSMESAASSRGISAHTARSQLKRIFSKTGVNRQADLVRLLLSSVIALDELPDDLLYDPDIERKPDPHDDFWPAARDALASLEFARPRSERPGRSLELGPGEEVGLHSAMRSFAVLLALLPCVAWGVAWAAGGDAAAGSPAYRFSADWFTKRIPMWAEQLEPLAGREQLRYLEVGPYEGRSFVWMLDNVLTHPTARATAIDIFATDTGYHYDESYEATFRSNVALSGAAERVTIIKGPSQLELRRLPLDPFDVIYIDGSHDTPDVLADIVLAWPLLKEGGLMFLDDYRWNSHWPFDLRPAFAINSFISAFSRQLEVVHRDVQVVLRKRPDACAGVHYEGCSYIGPYLYDWNTGGRLLRAGTHEEVPLAPEEKKLVEQLIRSNRLGHPEPSPSPKLRNDERFRALNEKLGLGL